MKDVRLPLGAARVFALLCALAAPLFLPACSGSERALPSVNIVAELQPDGSLRITEEVSYRLQAGVRSVSHALEAPGGGEIVNVSAAGLLPGGQRVTFAPQEQAELGDSGALIVQPADDSHLLLTLYHPFADAEENVTLTYRYTLRGMAARYSDAGTFTWEPLGSRGWAVSIAQWSARIALPAGLQDRLHVTLLQAPSRAELAPLSDGMLLTAQSVRAGARARIQVDFAPEALVYVPETPGEPLAALRAAARAQEGQRALLGYGWVALCALASLGLSAWLYRRVDHDPRLLPPKLRQGPSLGVTAPAELSTLAPFAGGVGYRDLTAMLLHLIHRNHLALLPPDAGRPLTRETMGQARLIRLPAPRDTLLDGEFFLIHWFIDTLGDGKSMTLERIRRTPRARIAADYRVWRQLVNEQIAQRPWFKDLRAQRRALTALGGALLLGTPAMLALGALPVAWLGAPIGLAVIVYALRMRRRTPSAAQEVHRWRSLRAQLLAGRIHGASTIAQWERILLYAEAMGLGRQAADAMQSAVAAEAKGEAPPWPDAHEATFMAWPLLEYPGHLARWFELLCEAILPAR